MEEEKYMRRCIELAKNGLCNVAPNPMVGAVIVCDGRIIGEGYHIRCGEAHAEVNAIRSVKDKSLLSRSTIYVSLEPCSHYGKTPPCADLIIEETDSPYCNRLSGPVLTGRRTRDSEVAERRKRSDSRRTGEGMQTSDPALYYFQYAAPPLYHTKMGRIG